MKVEETTTREIAQKPQMLDEDAPALFIFDAELAKRPS